MKTKINKRARQKVKNIMRSIRKKREKEIACNNKN